MVVLSIVLQYVTPKSFCFFFLSWFFNQYLFFTKVSEQLLSIVCKHLVLPVVFTSFFISPDSFIWAFSFNFPFEGFSYCLQILVCCHFVFLFNSLLFLGDLWVSPLCAMSVSIDRSVLMLLIWFSLLAFYFGCCRLLLFIIIIIISLICRIWLLVILLDMKRLFKGISMKFLGRVVRSWVKITQG